MMEDYQGCKAHMCGEIHSGNGRCPKSPDEEGYVHGYSERETERLYDQAGSVRDLLHHDTGYPGGCCVLEAGCGVGAQTVTVAKKSPNARIVSIDISAESLARAQAFVAGEGISNVEFQPADIYALPFPDESFDHVFVCYVLEHLREPGTALESLRRVLKPGGSITVIEGDHGSCYYHPQTPEAVRAWNCLIEAQARLGGDSLIGRRLLPLIEEAGFRDVRVSPRMVYADRTKPSLMDSFVNKTIIPMVEGVKDLAASMELIDEATWKAGIEDFYRIPRTPKGTFCYTFFKAVGFRKQPD